VEIRKSEHFLKRTLLNASLTNRRAKIFIVLGRKAGKKTGRGPGQIPKSQALLMFYATFARTKKNKLSTQKNTYISLTHTHSQSRTRHKHLFTHTNASHRKQRGNFTYNRIFRHDHTLHDFRVM